MKQWTLIACALAVSGCGGDSGSANPPPPITLPPPSPTPTPTPTASIPYPAGLTAQAITVAGTGRTFQVHVPTGLTRARAVIVDLHGGGGSGLNAATSSPASILRQVATREGLIIVYPDGTNNQWNDCRSDASNIIGNADDVGFLDALLSRLEGELQVTSSQIFITGISNGGMMAMRYAFERPSRFAAMAISSANLPLNPKPGLCTSGPSRAVAILLTHGSLDQIMPYAGGCIALNLTLNCDRGRVISAEATRDYWLQRSGLLATTPTNETVERDPNDGGSAIVSRYAGAAPVQWWRLVGAGHSQPSIAVPITTGQSGVQNRDVEFAKIAWAFFAARLP